MEPHPRAPARPIAGRDLAGLLARWLPALVLAGIASVQMHSVATANLSRWKGSGFGMFSTVDSPATRVLRLRLLAGGQEIPVLPPSDLKELAIEARVLPTEEHLRRLGDALVRRVWVPVRVTRAQSHYQAMRAIPTPDAEDIKLPYYRALAEHEVDTAPADALTLQGVRVSVWAASFQGATRALALAELRNVTIHKEP